MNIKPSLLAPFTLGAVLLSGCTIHTYDPGPTIATRSAVFEPSTTPPAPPPPVVPVVRKKPTTEKLVFLGMRPVNFKVDKDTISVNKAGKFRALKLHISGSPMALYDVRVMFADGSRFSPPARLHFNQGSWTRTIDLPGDKRRIKKVEFLYRSKGPKSGRAKVQLFGVR